MSNLCCIYGISSPSIALIDVAYTEIKDPGSDFQRSIHFAISAFGVVKHGGNVDINRRCSYQPCSCCHFERSGASQFVLMQVVSRRWQCHEKDQQSTMRNTHPRLYLARERTFSWMSRSFLTQLSVFDTRLRCNDCALHTRS